MVSTASKTFWIVCFCLVLVSCKDESATKPVVSPDVSVVTVGKQDVKVYEQYVGQTYGQSDIQVQPRVQGWVTGIYFKEGLPVEKGQLLYTLDGLQQKTRVDGAEADVAKAQAAMDNKKTELDRVQPLAEMNALSQRELDAAKAALELAANDVKIAQARLADARIELSYTRILAPLSGIIGISKVLVGDYVGSYTTGGGINTISSLGEVKVRFPISENDYLRFVKRIQENPKSNNFTSLPVQLILGDGSIYPEPGKIDLTNRQIDQATGSLLVQAIFGNRTGILRPGQYVKVRFQTDQFNGATVVPQQAINQLQNIYQVFLLTDSNYIKPTVVSVGSRIGSNWIITQGVEPGQKVVLVGSASLNPKVVVNPTVMNWNYDSTSKN